MNINNKASHESSSIPWMFMATQSNILEGYDQYPYLVLALDISKKWGPIFVSIVGIFGNVVSFLITTKKEYSHISTCTYMSALAVFDTVFLLSYVSYVPYFFGMTFPYYLTVLKVITYIVYSSATSSRLSLAAMTVDRACAVLFPLKAKTLCTVSRARKIIIVLTITPAVININVIFTYQIQMIGDDINAVVLTLDEYPWLEVIIVIYQAVVTAIVPFCIILISNVFILRGVRRASRNRSRMGQSERARSSRENSKENKNLTRMLLLVSFAFVVCCSPYMLYEFLFTIPAVYQTIDYSSTYWLLRMGVIVWATALITQMNSAVNFYLYVLGGGNKFRTDAKNVLRMCGACKPRIVT